MPALQLLLIVIVSYLIGSLPSAYIVTLLVKRINIFEVGSGNMGGTNVARTLGLGWGIFTALLDVLKGILAVIVAQWLVGDGMQLLPLFADGLSPSATTGIDPDFLVPLIIAGLAAVAGHNWSFFATALYTYYRNEFAIRGGKGAATAFGTMLALLPIIPNIILLAVGITLALLTRFASLSVLLSFSTAFIWTIQWAVFTINISTVYVTYVVVLSFLILWRFRENIERLGSGTERKLGERVTTQ